MAIPMIETSIVILYLHVFLYPLFLFLLKTRYTFFRDFHNLVLGILSLQWQFKLHSIFT